MNLRKRRVVVRNIARPFDRFFTKISSGGMLLMLATIIALIWANSPLQDLYEILWKGHLSIVFEPFKKLEPIDFGLSLLHWVNDGLMVLFFFVIGLEIKREVLAGELKSFRQAIFPIFAAIGGVITPMIIYFSFGLEGEASRGWGIPMATDIAFSLAILSMLGPRVPLSLKVFLTALAIADDLAAILVIALFYGGTVAWPYLFAAFILLAILAIANYYDVQQVALYAVLGIIIWYLFLQSGVHATIAGVLIAMTVPARTKLHARNFIPKVKWRLRKFANIPTEGQSFLLDDDQLNAINDIEIIMQEVQSPLQKMEHRLSGVVNYFILPLFALSNAGVVLMASGSSLASITEVFTALSLIIAASLIFGKVIGISLFSWLAVKFKLAVKPEKVSWLSYIGLGFLGGIGFTMSIFIATLAFDDPALQDQAKIGIFVGSIISGIAGFFLLKYSLRPKAKIKK